MQESARRIAKVSIESKIIMDEEEYVSSFRPELMDVAYAWSKGAKFAQICKMTDIFEGSIIRVFRRLEELLRQMCVAAKSIGNTELEAKFSEGNLFPSFFPYFLSYFIESKNPDRDSYNFSIILCFISFFPPHKQVSLE